MKSIDCRIAPEFLVDEEPEVEAEEMEIEAAVADAEEEAMILDVMNPNDMDFEDVVAASVENNAAAQSSPAAQDGPQSQVTATDHETVRPAAYFQPVLQTREQRLQSLVAALGPGTSVSLAAQFGYVTGVAAPALYPRASGNENPVNNPVVQSSSEVHHVTARAHGRRHGLTAGVLSGHIPAMRQNIGLTRASAAGVNDAFPRHTDHPTVVELNAIVYQLTQMMNSNFADITGAPARGPTGSQHADEARIRHRRRIIEIFIRFQGQMEDFMASEGNHGQGASFTAIMTECYDLLSLEGPSTEVFQRRMYRALDNLISFIREQIRRFLQGEGQAVSIGMKMEDII